MFLVLTSMQKLVSVLPLVEANGERSWCLRTDRTFNLTGPVEMSVSYPGRKCSFLIFKPNYGHLSCIIVSSALCLVGQVQRLSSGQDVALGSVWSTFLCPDPGWGTSALQPSQNPYPQMHTPLEK